jgi:hypothetical protein
MIMRISGSVCSYTIFKEPWHYMRQRALVSELVDAQTESRPSVITPANYQHHNTSFYVSAVTRVCIPE